MLFRQLFDCDSATYTYLIASAGQALLIDPVKEQVPLYLQLLQELQLTLVAALDTHVHADHITALGTLRAKTNCELLMGEHSKMAGLSRHLKEGDEINIGDVTLKTLYTPGHTDDSYSFVMSDRVFTGDALLIRGTGRTDFQHGDAQVAYENLMNKLLTLPPETLVYPAHDYKGMTVSTIGEEKHYNPRLQVSSAQEYAEIMDSLNLPPPKKIDTAVPANLNGGLDV